MYFLYIFPGFVITSDIDFLLTHMNNARFLRELDFARIDHGTRSGFMEETLRRGGSILLGSSFIRYRLPLPVFSRYKVSTHEEKQYLNIKVIKLVFAFCLCLRYMSILVVFTFFSDCHKRRLVGREERVPRPQSDNLKR